MKKFILYLTIITLMAAATGCASQQKAETTNAGTNSNTNISDANTDANTEPTADTKQVPAEIRIGYWESPNGELLVKETGTLEKKYPDTKVTWVQFESGSDILTAIQGGSIDLATIGTPPGALGIANGLPYKIYYLHDVISESEGLIVKNSANISSMEDLKGKKIATTFGTTSHFSLLHALTYNGMKESDLTLYDMQPSDIFAAWQRGDIDGAYIWESTKSKLINEDGTEIISSGEVAEQGALTGEMGIVHNDFYEKYPDVLKDYIDLLDEAVAKYKNEPEESAKLMAQGLGLTEEETLTSMNEIIVLTKEDQFNAKYLGSSSTPGDLAQLLKDTADFLVTQKSLTKAPEKEDYQNAILTDLYQ